MKNKYLINVQFVSTNAKFEKVEQEAVKEAISNYNTKSLIAKNPKQITDYSFSNDEMTLTLVLESEAYLPMPTKALRLLSSYLVETSLDKYLSGKQLFKMTTASAAVVSDKNSADSILSPISMDIEEFRTLSNDEKLVEIYKLLLERGV